jgi:hypothetical protein
MKALKVNHREALWRRPLDTVAAVPTLAHLPTSRMRPNLSFNRSANGRPPGPGRRYAVHCLRPGPGALPLSPG